MSAVRKIAIAWSRHGRVERRPRYSFEWALFHSVNLMSLFACVALLIALLCDGSSHAKLVVGSLMRIEIALASHARGANDLAHRMMLIDHRCSRELILRADDNFEKNRASE